MTSPTGTATISKEEVSAALNAHTNCQGSLTDRIKAALIAAAQARPAAPQTGQKIMPEEMTDEMFVVALQVHDDDEKMHAVKLWKKLYELAPSSAAPHAVPAGKSTHGPFHHVTEEEKRQCPECQHYFAAAPTPPDSPPSIDAVVKAARELTARVREDAMSRHSVYNRKNKIYEFGDDEWKAGDPHGFELYQNLRAALSAFDQGKPAGTVNLTITGVGNPRPPYVAPPEQGKPAPAPTDSALDALKTAEWVGYYFGLQRAGNHHPHLPGKNGDGGEMINALHAWIGTEMEKVVAKLPTGTIDAWPRAAIKLARGEEEGTDATKS